MSQGEHEIQLFPRFQFDEDAADYHFNRPAFREKFGRRDTVEEILRDNTPDKVFEMRGLAEYMEEAEASLLATSPAEDFTMETLDRIHQLALGYWGSLDACMADLEKRYRAALATYTAYFERQAARGRTIRAIYARLEPWGA